MDLT
jgi:hypothetical protein